MSTLVAFGIGFVARPLGAVFFGRLGDSRGRKLSLLIAMPMMGLGTLLMGILLPYAAIRVRAPILLVVGRLPQGFSAGGELGNGVAFLVEWTPERRRALFSSMQQCSTIFETLVGSGAAALLTSTLSTQDLEIWGWRLPFRGWLSDQIGREPLLLIAAAAFVVIPYPVFNMLVTQASPTLSFPAVRGRGCLSRSSLAWLRRRCRKCFRPICAPPVCRWAMGSRRRSSAASLRSSQPG
ncbi:MFS transporter [Bosea beijingensis]|uniref:MFS transporter n=1 Tax=Bosea beijingensis TaxID=3068632 RepID=UPI002740BAB8|nr:MFS transporter [Bosea sp. REN20]